MRITPLQRTNGPVCRTAERRRVSADLIDDQGRVHQVRAAYWDFVLWLAEEYGWRPAGTLAPSGVADPDWDGGYSENGGQRVVAEDASEFAAALDRAMADPERAQVERRVSDRLNEHVRELFLRDGIELPPEDDEDYSTADSFLQSLSTFARQGSFRVF